MRNRAAAVAQYPARPLVARRAPAGRLPDQKTGIAAAACGLPPDAEIEDQE
jgi:hypothetical protein